MADVKISQLTQSTSAAGSSELAISEGGVSYRISKDNFLSGVENPVLESKTVLTSAQIKTLNSSPVTLVAAPGATEFIDVISVVYIYRYGTEVFNFGFTKPQIKINGNQFLTITGINAAASDLVKSSPINSLDEGGINKPVILESGVDATTGDGSLVVNLLYRITDLSQL